MWSIFRRNVMLSEAKHLASLEEPDPSLRCSENVYLKLRFGCHWQLVCQCPPSQAPHWQTSCQWHPTFVLRGSGAAQSVFKITAVSSVARATSPCFCDRI